MPIPVLLIGAAVATGVIGIAKGGEAAIKNNEAKELMEEAQYMFESQKRELDEQREQTTAALSEYGKLKIRIWDEQFSRFIRLFSRIKNVTIEGRANVDYKLRRTLTTEELSEMRQLSITANELVSGGVAALGAGALAGVASYGGAMMFASASTGTAIASLSGAAATNATLAWFGGGSLLSGGLGMAGGTLVLGGLVAGPILAVGGILMASKANANLAEARAKYREAEAAVEELKYATDVLEGIQALSEQYHQFSVGLEKAMIYALDQLETIVEYRVKKTAFAKRNLSVEYSDLHEEEKKVLHFITVLVQLTKVVLEKPLLQEEGSVDPTSQDYIDAIDLNAVFEGV